MQEQRDLRRENTKFNRASRLGKIPIGEWTTALVSSVVNFEIFPDVVVFQLFVLLFLCEEKEGTAQHTIFGYIM